jgi:hypothetical protein
MAAGRADEIERYAGDGSRPRRLDIQRTASEPITSGMSFLV